MQTPEAPEAYAVSVPCMGRVRHNLSSEDSAQREETKSLQSMQKFCIAPAVSKTLELGLYVPKDSTWAHLELTLGRNHF